MILKRIKYYSEEDDSEDIDSPGSNTDFAKKAAIVGAGAVGAGALSNFVKVNEDVLDDVKNQVHTKVENKSSKLHTKVEEARGVGRRLRNIKNAALDEINNMSGALRSKLRIKRRIKI